MTQDTAQRRAEAWMAQHGCYGGTMLTDLTNLLQQARREALEEAVKVVSIYNCYHNHGKKATKACDDIVELLDRLREGVEG